MNFSFLRTQHIAATIVLMLSIASVQPSENSPAPREGSHVPASHAMPNIKTYGLKITVPDMDKAVDFFCTIFGFEIESKDHYLFGLVSELLQSGQQQNDRTNESSPAAAFERFKKLEGKWLGRSTKGWQETVSFKTIARGSVVVENSFDAHPQETMMTMFHLDGDQLMLTHYCVAGSQPRLKATSIEDQGKTITFTFLDATNLKSRDQGHMDKAVFRFLDDDHFTAQWTWYQNGKENWMEEIQMKRQPH